MSSHLDLSLPTDDDGIFYAPGTSPAKRRGKRTTDTASAAPNKVNISTSGGKSNSFTSTALQTANDVVTLPLLLLFHIITILFQFASNILPEPIIRPIANLMESSSETDKILKEMPAKQSKLQSDIGKVDKDQTKLKKDMDALRERIGKIQERRERWAKQAADIDREKKE